MAGQVEVGVDDLLTGTAFAVGDVAVEVRAPVAREVFAGREFGAEGAQADLRAEDPADVVLVGGEADGFGEVARDDIRCLTAFEALNEVGDEADVLEFHVVVVAPNATDARIGFILAEVVVVERLVGVIEEFELEEIGGGIKEGAEHGVVLLFDLTDFAEHLAAELMGVLVAIKGIEFMLPLFCSHQRQNVESCQGANLAAVGAVLDRIGREEVALRAGTTPVDLGTVLEDLVRIPALDQVHEFAEAIEVIEVFEEGVVEDLLGVGIRLAAGAVGGQFNHGLFPGNRPFHRSFVAGDQGAQGLVLLVFGTTDHGEGVADFIVGRKLGEGVIVLDAAGFQSAHGIDTTPGKRIDFPLVVRLDRKIAPAAVLLVDGNPASAHFF